MRKNILLILFVVSQVLIFYFGLIPQDMAAKQQFGIIDLFRGYIAHFIAFFVTALILVMLLREIRYGHPYLAAILYTLLAAVMLEVFQLFTGYRTFDVIDIVWGMIGSTFSTASIKALSTFR